MSKKSFDIPGASDNQQAWEKALNKLNAEIAASDTLTEEEKRFLLEEMDELSDDEGEPIVCSGEPISETIVKDRGER
jgi:hypothetical protein